MRVSRRYRRGADVLRVAAVAGNLQIAAGDEVAAPGCDGAGGFEANVGRMRSYILDNSSMLEYQRLDLMSKILDPRTRELLASLGLREGWKCLELGSGNGSIAEWLCERVGTTGSVTAVDLNPQLVGLVPAQNLVVRQADVCTGELPAGPFDLVMCRALLHHIAKHAEPVLAKMAAAVKPGGWLFVAEPDFNIVRTAEPEVWRKAWEAIIAWGRASGVDWCIGRRLPAMVQALGFGYPQASSDLRNIRGTTRDALFYRLFFEFERLRWLKGGALDAQTLDAAAALLDDPDCWTQCWMVTSVWVRRPPQV